jgi:Tol biopolymer transport system component
MADLFLSYSRRDKVFVQRLGDALTAQGRDLWVDWQDIPATADWWKEVVAGIEAADSFVFVISPDSVQSEVCRRELEQAVANNKRFVPLLHRDLAPGTDQVKMHPAIGSHNWIYFRETDDFDAALALLNSALDTDLSHVRMHTRLLIRAKEWDSNQRNGSFLLRGEDLRRAEEWLADAIGKKPAPTPLHADYIAAGREAETRRQRQLLIGVSIALVVALALTVLSLLLYTEANVQRGIAYNNAATATFAQGQAEISAVTATVAQGQAEINAATATVAQGQAEFNAATATVAQGQAQQAATTVADERNSAQSIAVAGQAQVEIFGPLPDRAPLLALNAIQARYTWQAERALALSVQDKLEQAVLRGHRNIVTSVDWSRDSRFVATASDDGAVRIWNASGQNLLTLQGVDAAVNRAIWSPDGTRLAAVYADGTARVWSVGGAYEAPTTEVQFILSAPNSALLNLAWSPDGSALATSSSGGTAQVWDMTSGELRASLIGHSGESSSVAFSPDGTKVVTASSDGTARIWDAVTSDELLRLIGHSRSVIRAMFSPDGTRVLTASADNTARLWDAVTGEQLFVLTGHTRRVTRAAFSPDGARIATASDDNTARIWDVQTGTLLRTMFGHTGTVNGLVWSPGGRRLITVSEDRTARIWDTESGGQLLVFSGHTDVIFSAAWSPDGQYFATASADNTARVWQIWKNAQNLVTLARRCCAGRILTDEENIQFGLPTATPAPVPTAIASCTGILPSRLYPGARGTVTTEDTASVRVRSAASTDATRIGQVAPGQTFQVLSGPVCNENIAWFEIIYGIGALHGFIAEGQNDVYFVEPILPQPPAGY